MITQDAQVAITNNIEATRLEQEEQLSGLGFRLAFGVWYEGAATLSALTQGLRLG